MSTAHSTNEYRVIWLIRRLFRSLAQNSNKNLESLGLSAADRAVMEFLYPDEKLSVPEIAEKYHVTRQHVQVTVNPLLERGLLATKANPKHKKSVLIALTKAGRNLFKKVILNESGAIEKLFSDIPSSDIKTTAFALEVLLRSSTKESKNER